MKEENKEIKVLVRRILTGIGILLLTISSWQMAKAQTVIPDPTDTENIDEQKIDSVNWKVVTLQGKFKMQGLPLSPSVKIFMERDSLIDLSLRAPFVGEVGRLMMTPDSILIINKMSKSFWRGAIPRLSKGEVLDSVARDYWPLGIGEVQDLLLAKFFLPGIDVESEEIGEFIDVYLGEEEGQFNVIPKGAAEIEGVKYGFVIDEEFRPLMLMVLPHGHEEMEIDAVYTYKSSGYDLQFLYIDGHRQIEAVLELKEPEWKGEAPKEIDLGKKYKETGIWEVFK